MICRIYLVKTKTGRTCYSWRTLYTLWTCWALDSLCSISTWLTLWARWTRWSSCASGTWWTLCSCLIIISISILIIKFNMFTEFYWTYKKSFKWTYPTFIFIVICWVFTITIAIACTISLSHCCIVVKKWHYSSHEQWTCQKSKSKYWFFHIIFKQLKYNWNW